MSAHSPCEIEQRSALENHFYLLYELMIECKFISNAICETVNGVRNAATILEHRNRGHCKALTLTALQNAIGRGCRLGITYLSSEQKALRIVNGLGGRHVYSFNTYYAPKDGME